MSHLIVSAVPTPTVLTHLNNNIVTTTVNIRVARGHRDIISASASGSGSGRDNKEEVVKEGYHTLRENALMEHIRSLGGIPTGVDPSLVRAKLAVIRQDYATYHAYSVHHRVGFQPVLLQAEQKKEQKQNQEQESGQCCDKSTKTMNARPHDLMLPDKIACNISIFSASHDKMVDHTQMQNWGEFTWGTHEHVSFKGSHFYLIESSSSTYGGPSRAVSATDEACAGKVSVQRVNMML